MSSNPLAYKAEPAIVQLKNFINKNWQVVDKQLNSQLFNASTGALLGAQAESSEPQIEQALEATRLAFEPQFSMHSQSDADGWCTLSAAQRRDVLLACAEQLSLAAPAIAEADSISTGVVIKLSRSTAAICAAAFAGAAQLLDEPAADTDIPGPLLQERLPLGPAAIIGPWNAPAGIVCHKLASALAAGCPCIIKPSEWAPYSAQLILEALLKAGLPADACQLLHGTASTAAAVVADSRITAVSFTGGLQGGRAVAAACARDIKPAQLELGGNNPLLVLSDADLDLASEHIVAALTTLNGQWCRALGRLLVHEDVESELMQRLATRLGSLKLGDALDEASEMGPLAHQQHLNTVEQAVAGLQALGGVAHQYTRLPALNGWFYPPTLINGLNPEDTREEIFGPVATVHSFQSDEDAVALANGTDFGLAAYVFGEEQHAWAVARHLRTGITKINAVSLFNLSPQAPRPAWGLSGLGEEGTRETFEFFRGTRLTGVIR